MQEYIEDSELIGMVLKGQQSAYAILVDRYSKYVFTLVLRFVENREVAEELAQDIFVKAYKYLADFKGNSKFSTWLYTIVNTTCISHTRKKKDEIVFMEQEQFAALPQQYTGVERPTDRLELKTQKQLIENAMKHLPESDSRILSLFYLAEQSVDEIGMIMGLTTSNVKVKLMRARGKLKEIMETKYARETMAIK